MEKYFSSPNRGKWERLIWRNISLLQSVVNGRGGFGEIFLFSKKEGKKLPEGVGKRGMEGFWEKKTSRQESGGKGGLFGGVGEGIIDEVGLFDDIGMQHLRGFQVRKVFRNG